MAKRILAVLCIAIVVSLFAGVAGAEKLHILVNMRSVAEYKPAWDELVANFRAANPDIELEVTVGTTVDQLQTMVLANAAPDVVHFDRYMVSAWASQGFLEPVDSYVRGIDMKKQFLNGPLQEVIFQGKTWAVPFDIDIRGLFWNVAHLNEAGLDSQRGPQTWTELNTFADKLTKRKPDGVVSRVGFIPWIGNLQWMGWVWSFGGDYFDPVTFRPTLNRPENVKAFEWEASYAERYGIPSVLYNAGINDYFQNFPNGTMSMVAAHYHASPRYLQTNPNLDFWGGPVPHTPQGENGTWSGGYSFIVPKGVKNPKAAARFLQYVADPDTQVRYYKSTKGLPSTQAGIAKVTPLAQPLERIFLQQASISKWRHPLQYLYDTKMREIEQQVVGLTKSPAAALEEAQQWVLAQFPNMWGKAK